MTLLQRKKNKSADKSISYIPKTPLVSESRKRGAFIIGCWRAS